ncbi:MAG: hypothetical protein Q7R75_02015 [bacterium]|nr:hypothetical protein [bacterium]
MVLKSILKGVTATLILLAVYLTLLTLISGWFFAKEQFFSFWYFIIGLATGFGTQIALYSYLKNKIHSKNSGGKVLAISGTTSTIAMVSCCSHYLVNILPIIGVTGVVSLVGQYQIEFFWLGIVFNLIGIWYISSKIIKFLKTSPKI